MNQLLQDLRTGETRLVEVPVPSRETGHLLIRSKCSLVSLGTERMLVQFGHASLFQKARLQPEKLRQVLSKIRSDGLLPTLETIYRRLDEPVPLGYSNAGEVVEVGEDVVGFAVGDRVLSNGPHAEYVSVPANLAAKIPPNVGDDQAAFGVVGAVAMQSIRLVRPEFGETVAIFGLGLIGQMLAQLLRANGCRVIGYEPDGAKRELAARFGVRVASIEDPVMHALDATAGHGVDAVIISASTSSDTVIAQSARMCRKRGRVVLVGVVGLSLNRADFYEKEITFQVSCSYGPGRYDRAYEEENVDYPIGFVRWTETRNFQAVLQALSDGMLKVTELVTRRVPLAQFREVYSNLESGVASLLFYATARDQPRARTISVQTKPIPLGGGNLAVIGAGNYVKMAILPALSKVRAPIKALISERGASGTVLAQKYGVPQSSTEMAAILSDPLIQGVIIATRHDLHARMVAAAIRARKHILVEKPLCLTVGELHGLEALVAEAGGEHCSVAVGFNRRFSAHAMRIRELVSGAGPVSLTMTVNAGAVPPGHWVHDPAVGGGRILGEACHFIDLASFLTKSPIADACASRIAEKKGADNVAILLRHKNGSISTINYFSTGNRNLPKERLEIHHQGRSLALDNFRLLQGFGFCSFRRLKTRQDKGHEGMYAAFVRYLTAGGPPLVSWPEIVNSTRATFAVMRSLAENRWVSVEEI